MAPNQLKIIIAIAAALAITACSNGGGSSGNGSGDGLGDSSRGSNSEPSLQLSDGDVLGGGSGVVRIPAGDDTGIARVGSTLLRQGPLAECAGNFADDSLVANSLVEACISDQLGCEVTFQPFSDQIEVIPPPLYAPIGLEYAISLVDRDGSATAPVTSVFCFDVGANAAPVAAADTFQLTFPNNIIRDGVSYSDRCEKLDGSEGVLANDEDDEHITNTCLSAELVDLPRYASNLSSFADTFRADGGFVYETLGDSPPEDVTGKSFDTFSYRITDGVNPPSEPIIVEIVFTSGNRPPVAADDTFDVSEDSNSIFLSVLDNDLDPDALPLSVTRINNGPGSGVATIRNGVQIEYRPNAGFVGVDRFNYTAADSGGLTVTANVVINVSNVNDAPYAQNDSATTNENVAMEINVRSNDSDVEGDSLNVVSVAAPLHGTTSVLTSGNVLYTPSANYSGPDSFEYTISDGVDTATATVVMQVIFINVAPAAMADEFSILEGASEEFNILANDSDGDGDALTIVSISDPSNGVVELLPSGNVRYTPNADFNGRDESSYTLSDGTVESSSQVVFNVTAVNDEPVATDDSASTSESVPVSINLVDNDTDIDGNSLTVASVSEPASGTVVVNDDNRSVTYTPVANFSGQVNFTYTISDGEGGTASASVVVDVSDTNFAPEATDDSANTAENEAVSIDVLDNDNDQDGDQLSVAVVQTPENGTVIVESAGVIRYSPAAGFTGTDTFRYSVTDPVGLTSSAGVTINVSNTNDAPIATDDNAGTSENTAVQVDVQANDNDADGDDLAVVVVDAPANGTAQITESGAIRYTPESGFSGTDTFTYSVTDPSGLSDTATVTVLVNNINDSPVAANDSASTSENTAVRVDVQANDNDADGDDLSVVVVDAPANGTAQITVSGAIRYTPAAGFSGTDTFTYSVTDPSGLSDTATVTVVVSNTNDAPVAANDSVSTGEGTAVRVEVLANDSDSDGDDLSVVVVDAPANGAAQVTAAGAINYTPAAGFSGTDTFAYSVTDPSGLSDTATVTVVVNNINDAPVAANDSVSTSEDTAVQIVVLANDSDPDGDDLSVAVVGAPANGTAQVAATNAIGYTPAAGFSGTDTFTYSVTDPSGLSVTATVTVVVNNINDAPVAANDSVSTSEDTAILIDLLANDSDPDGDNLSVAVVDAPTNGTAQIAATGAISYTPSAGFSGTDTFTYSVTDPSGLSDTATVTVAVNNINDAPVAANDSASTSEDTSVQIVVLANDTDPDSDNLSVAVVDAPANGTAQVTATSAISYTPASGFSGTDTFTYSVTDPSGLSDTATVIVAVNNINDAPVAANDSASTSEDTSVQIVVLANDTDPDSDNLSVAVVDAPANGTAQVTATSAISYTPAPGFSGTDTFTYSVTDPSGLAASATVTVTVSDVNEAPAASNDSVSTNADTAIQVDVLDNDNDPDGDQLTLLITSPAASGTAVVGSGGVLYTPASGFSGVDEFSYSVTDPSGASDTATVIVTVVSVNQAPIAIDDSQSTDENVLVNIDVLDNDSDPDGDALALSVVSQPANGTAVVSAVGTSIAYTPVTGFSGIDSFIYEIADSNGGSATATATISVSSVNAVPVAVDDIAEASQGVAVNFNILANDTDPDGDALTVAIVSPPANGSAAVLADNRITYTSLPSFAGVDSIVYSIDDGNGGTDTATVEITVIGPINIAPVAVDDAAITDQDVAVTVLVLANDGDPDGDPLTVSIDTVPANGIATLSAGSIIYTPAALFSGVDAFTYQISDPDGAIALATVTVTVNAVVVNVLPLAVDDTITTDQDTAVVIAVLANDTDADSDVLTVSAVTPTVNGGAALINLDNTVTYTPLLGYSGVDSFEYTVTDSVSGPVNAAVTVTVTAAQVVPLVVNTPPVAVDDDISVNANSTTRIVVLSNDTDVDGDTLVLSLDPAILPSNGIVDLHNNGRWFNYTPDDDFLGADSFGYIIDDSNGGTDMGLVTIAVIDL